MDTFFAVSSPGLEGITAQELRNLGYSVKPAAGGVEFTGALPDLYRANLCLRTASRVLVRLGEFYAAAFSELRKKASRLPWERFIPDGLPVVIHATSHKSRLYHSDAVVERVAGAISDRIGKTALSLEPNVSEDGPDDDKPSQMIVVRLVRDLCTISVDSSGELLHRRGYRQATAKAPLRETLAAALLLASGWDKASPLLDPFCGSGTIAIEAALLALDIPPGRSRRFALMDWPGYDPSAWEELLARESSSEKSASPLIQASDRDAGAIQMAQDNAKRAGVANFIEFSQRAFSAISPPLGPGWVVTNPPYGVRVTSGKDLRNLYAQLGNVLRRRCPNWQAAILCNDLRLVGQTILPLDPVLSFSNGGIQVSLYQGQVQAIE